MLRSILMMGLVLASTAVCAQSLYRWVDKDGKVHYTDTAPTNATKQADKSKLASPAPGEEVGLGYANQIAAKNFPVSLYTAPKCGDLCDQARRLLNARGVRFSEVSVTDSRRQEELVRLVGAAELPALVVGKEVHKGFDTGLYNSALDTAGYAKSAAPGQKKIAAPVEGAPANKQPDNEPPPRPKGRYAD